MDGVERGDLDEDIGCGGKLSVDKLQIAERSEKRCAAGSLLLPAFAGRKAQRGKKGRQPVVGRGTAGRPQK